MNAFLKLIPYIFSLVGLAERFVSNPKSGAEKKAIVLQGVRTALDAMTDVSTGGQKETWQSIQGATSELIDAAAAIRFPKE